MRFIYPLKTVQIFVTLLSIYALIRTRQLCSERTESNYLSELEKLRKHHRPCSINVIETGNVYNFQINETVSSNDSLVRRKRNEDPVKILPTDEDYPNVRARKTERSLEYRENHDSIHQETTPSKKMEKVATEQVETKKEQKKHQVRV